MKGATDLLEDAERLIDLLIDGEPEDVEAEVASLAARMAQNPEALKRTMERNGTLRALEASLLEAKTFAKIMAEMQITDTIVSEGTAASTA